jgi:hypothetical protein
MPTEMSKCHACKFEGIYAIKDIALCAECIYIILNWFDDYFPKELEEAMDYAEKEAKKHAD